MQSDDIYKENRNRKHYFQRLCVCVCVCFGADPISFKKPCYLVNALPNLTPAVELRKKKPVFPRTSIVYTNVNALCNPGMLMDFVPVPELRSE